jgi:O-antigen/teichoic acid export membrane protein
MSKPKSLFTNAIWNIITVVITAIAGFILVPIIIKGIGIENFGIYTIILMIGGFAALQSLGLGEATLKFVSQYYAKKDLEGVNRVFGATLSVYIFSGFIISGLIIVFSSFIISWFKLSPENVENAIMALRIAGFAFLISIFSAALRTIPEATQRYDILSKYNLLMMLLRYSAMYFIATSDGGIIGLTFLTLGSAVVDIFVYSILAKKLIPGIKCLPSFSKNGIREVFSYGVFSFINDLIQRASAYVDQFILGVFFTASSVAYLTAPKDLITKAQGLTGAAGQALFPRFSSMDEGEEMQNLYSTSLWILTIFSIIIFIPLAIIVPSFLAKWLSPEFAKNSSEFARLFSLGVAFNGGTSAYFALLKGTGRIKLLTKFIMSIQLSAMILTGLLVYEFGIIGSGIRVLLFSFVGITICIYVGKKVFKEFPVKKNLVEAAIIPIALSLICFFIGASILDIYPLTSWVEIIIGYILFFVIIIFIQLGFNLIIFKKKGIGVIAFYSLKNYFMQIISNIRK